MSIVIKTTRSKFESVLHKIALPVGGTLLINPQKVTVDSKAGTLAILAKNSENTAKIEGIVGLEGIDGSGEIVINAEKMLNLMSVFTPEEEIEIEFADRVMMRGKVWKPTFPAESGATISVPKPFNLEKGVPVVKDGKMTTIVTADATVFSQMIDIATKVDTKMFPFKIDKDGHCVASFGSLEKKHDTIVGEFDVELKGEPAEFILAEEFIHVFGNLSGEFTLYTRPNHLVIIRTKNDDCDLYYAMSPKTKGK